MVRSLVLATAAILMPCGTLLAVDYSWNNTGGGTFSNAANWTPGGGPPVVGDKATFGLSTNYTVDFTANAASNFLFVSGTNQVTFDLAGNTYKVETGPSFATPSIEIGTSASDNVKLVVTDGTLDLREGNVTAPYVRMSASGGTSALEINNSGGAPGFFEWNYMDMFNGSSLTVTGSGSTMNYGGGYLQMNGLATSFTVSNGATANVANFASTGTVLVDNATLNSAASVMRNVASGGSFSVINGGSVNTSIYTFEMGVSGGAGVVNVGNGVGTSTVTATNVLFGTAFDPNRGAPEMRVNAGGLVKATGGSGESVYVYDQGTLTLNGGTVEVAQNATMKVADINNDNNLEGLLRGNGTIQRLTGGASNFSVVNDGDIRAGDTSASPAIGAINITNGNLTQNAGGTTFFEFGAAGVADLIDITSGTAAIGGSVTFANLGGPNLAVLQPYMQWEFVRADSITYTAGDNIASLLASYPGNYTFGVGSDGGQQVLVLAIPEPSAAAFVCGLTCLGCGVRRRWVRARMM